MSAPFTLSRARLAIRRGGGERERRSTAPYLIHQAVADLFGDRQDRGYLYRVTGEWPGGADVLLLSEVPPLPTDRVRSPDHRRAEWVESKPFTPRLSQAQRLDFEVRLNATQVVTGPDTDQEGMPKKNRRDVWEAIWQREPDTPLSPHEVYGAYLRRKLEGLAEVLDTRVTERGEVQARRGDCRDAARFVATNVIGTLRVLDPDAFLSVVGAGIGRAKAFGCGLLCISPPGTVLARRFPDQAAEML